MRLIDADALKERIDDMEVRGGHKYYREGMNVALHEFMPDLIDDQPTVDAVPVVHGQWIDKPTGAYGRWQSWCSVCGKHSGIGGIESNRHKPYCPNCGAKMDGGAEDG